LGVLSEPLGLLAWALAHYWFVAWGFVTLNAVLVDFVAEHVFPEVPYYNPKARPDYSMAERLKFTWEHLWNTGVLAILQILVRVDCLFPWIFKQLGLINQTPLSSAELHQQSVGANTNMTVSPSIDDPVLGVFGGELSPDLLVSCYRPGSGSVMGDMLVAFAFIQVGIVFADISYCAWHLTQHKYKFLNRITNHGYHHQFHYPIGACGSWLAWLDICFSATFSHLLPTGLTVAIFQAMGFFNLSDFGIIGWKFVLQMYIHEMNHFAHTGKQVPVWSGCPLFPPLGFALNLQDSIACHEAHHNFGNCSFGLLSVGDKIFGTAQYPVDHPKHIKKQKKVA